jgi:hypothetical protein
VLDLKFPVPLSNLLRWTEIISIEKYLSTDIDEETSYYRKVSYCVASDNLYPV